MKSYTYQVDDGVIAILDLRPLDARGVPLPSIEKKLIADLLFDKVDISLPIVICDQFGLWDQLIIKGKKLSTRKPLGATSLQQAKRLIHKTT